MIGAICGKRPLICFRCCVNWIAKISILLWRSACRSRGSVQQLTIDCNAQRRAIVTELSHATVATTLFREAALTKPEALPILRDLPPLQMTTHHASMKLRAFVN